LAQARKLADDPAVSPRKARSRVTNGKSYFVETDGRGPWGRRWRDLYEQILTDLGDPEGLNAEQDQEARRAATICIMCEKIEGRAVAGEDVDPDQYGTLSDRLGRSFRRLGLKPPRDDAGPGPLGKILSQGLSK
jgi:hypothetical protein